MAFDSTVMRALAHELHQTLAGGRISKIYQPLPDEILLLIYAGGANYRLLVSANARTARLHLAKAERRNPSAPPTFCMLLRKYIEGGRILAIEQVGRERICHLRIGTTDELGNPAEFLLVAEIMGKHSNLILIHPQGRIVDAIRRITEEVNRHRELLPGLRYVPPPPTGKLEPSRLTVEQLKSRMGDPTMPAWQSLLNMVDSLGPLLAREAIWRAGFPPEVQLGSIDLDSLVASTQKLVDLDDYAPALLIDPQNRLKEFHVLALCHWTGRIQTGFESISACLEAFYGRREMEDRIGALRGSLAKVTREEIARVRRKQQLQTEALHKAESAEEFRVQGELITANLWQISPGNAEAVVTNYYDPEGASVTIKLDPSLTPAGNAQWYYRRYQKAKSGRSAIHAQLSRSKTELAYLEQVEATIQDANSLPDLEEIRRELQAEGYLGEERTRRAQKKETKTEERPAPPLTIRSSDGWEIWIGRNNRQNDYLTLKLAGATDLWFHTKEIPGAHVILRLLPGRAVPDRAIHEAAAMAAWYSKGRESSSVPVDYTLRKHVRKPSGARPGMVIYDHHKTLWITPDPELHPLLHAHLGGLPDESSRNPAPNGNGDRTAD